MSSNRHHAKKRILLPEIAMNQQHGYVPLSGEKKKHLKTVLRLENGAALLATDGQGSLFEASIDYQKGDGAIILNEKILQESKPAEMILCICLPKNSTMDWVVEKAVECDATEIIPVVSSRSVVKPDPKELAKYATRWQSTMDAAMEQSERLWRASIAAPKTWETFLQELAKSAAGELRFSFVSELREDGQKAPLQQSCKKLESAFSANSRAKTVILIGPEGGFSAKEREECVNTGFAELSLGKTVQRVETAVISALTLIRASRSCFGAAS